MYLKNTDNVILIGKQFENKTYFYDQPISSSNFGIYEVKNLSLNFGFWSVFDTKKNYDIFFLR